MKTVRRNRSLIQWQWFRALGGPQSGVRVYGEQRGGGLADYDQDGRVYLVVSQNGAATKLFHNVGAKAGLRVRLKGPAANPQAVGAQVRLVSGEIKGPVREVQSGSGYWSQESSVPVLGWGQAAAPQHLWVRWPGGKVSNVPIPQGAKEAVVSFN